MSAGKHMRQAMEFGGFFRSDGRDEMCRIMARPQILWAEPDKILGLQPDFFVQE